ncbi:unnamed protein product [Adineta ricciae]|uniref:RRM domain-containing protein n=1 Tax=Adineta ricciae TaxID=249248 RepID=A0A816CBS3_ADIRI|nr:unnamed protein product [Adineta ricciae]
MSSSGNGLDQIPTSTAGSSTTTSNNPVNNNNTNSNNNSNGNNNNNPTFQSGRNSSDNMGHTFENPMQMFAMKQQPMTSPITGTIYTGPPAKYLSNGGMNSNGYASAGSMRPMLLPQQQQHQNRYGTHNGNNNNNGSSMQQQQRRQNNGGVDNATNDSVNTRKVFVGGLSPDTKMEHLCEYFTKFGNVESATVKFDKSGRSKGFGFVLFEDRDSTDKVYSQDSHIIQGKRVDTKSAHRRDQALARKVFVGGLDVEVTDTELRDYFSKFGKIAQIEAPVDKIKQKRRPFCFVLFENEESAEEVLQQPRHTINGKSIDCKRANPKSTENNQQNNTNHSMQAPMPHYNMPGLNQTPFQYPQQQRSQQASSHQQLQYQQAALAAQQQHYPFYNSSSMGMSSAQQHPSTNQQGQTRSQSNRQQLPSNNQGLPQPWSPISPAQWPNTNYDPRSYGSYGPSSASGSNPTWQVGPPPPQGNSYGQGRTPSNGPSGNPGNAAVGPPQAQPQFGGANSNSPQYSYASWGFGQPQGSQGPPSAGPPPNQYNYGAESTNGPPNAFAYPAPTAYDHFSSDSAPPSTYSR